MLGINNRCYILIVRMVSSFNSFQYIQPFPSMICSAYAEVKEGIQLQKPLLQLWGINQLNHLLQVSRMLLMHLMGIITKKISTAVLKKDIYTMNFFFLCYFLDIFIWVRN